MIIDRYDTFRIGITATTTVVRDGKQRGRIVAVHDDERSARADAKRRNQADVMRRVKAQARARESRNHLDGSAT